MDRRITKSHARKANASDKYPLGGEMDAFRQVTDIARDKETGDEVAAGARI
jgi:hypothetical protein